MLMLSHELSPGTAKTVRSRPAAQIFPLRCELMVTPPITLNMPTANMAVGEDFPIMALNEGPCELLAHVLFNG